MRSFALASFLIVPILIPGFATRFLEWLTLWSEMASFLLGGMLLLCCKGKISWRIGFPVLLLASWIIFRQGEFLSRSIIACFYLFFFFCMVQAGSALKDKEKMVAGALLISGILTGIIGWLQYFNLSFLGIEVRLLVDVPGMSGIIGQRNVFANWIACAIIALIYLTREEKENGQT